MPVGKFGELLSELLEAKDMSQRELGRRSGINHAYISQLINGKQGQPITPSRELVSSIADCLGSRTELLLAAGYAPDRFEEVLEIRKQHAELADSDLFKPIGKRLKALREEDGLAPYKLGLMLDIPPELVSDYEQGKRRPPYEMLIKFSDHFNVSIDYLLGRTDETQTADDISEATLEEILDSTIERQIYRGLKQLPDEKKRELYNFIRFLLTSTENEQENDPRRLV